MTQAEALLLSLAIEVPVAVGLGWALAAAPVGRLLLAALAATLLTHPLAWSAAVALSGEVPSVVRAALVEGAVIVAETAVFRWGACAPWPKAAAIAAAANLASYGAGVWLQS